MQGNLSIRYVPNQDADSLLSHLTRHLKHEFRKLRSSNTLEVEAKGRGCGSLSSHLPTRSPWCTFGASSHTLRLTVPGRSRVLQNNNMLF